MNTNFDFGAEAETVTEYQEATLASYKEIGETVKRLQEVGKGAAHLLRVTPAAARLMSAYARATAAKAAFVLDCVKVVEAVVVASIPAVSKSLDELGALPPEESKEFFKTFETVSSADGKPVRRNRKKSHLKSV
jgi:hypothetical protein